VIAHRIANMRFWRAGLSTDASARSTNQANTSTPEWTADDILRGRNNESNRMMTASVRTEIDRLNTVNPVTPPTERPPYVGPFLTPEEQRIASAARTIADMPYGDVVIAADRSWVEVTHNARIGPLAATPEDGPRTVRLPMETVAAMIRRDDRWIAAARRITGNQNGRAVVDNNRDVIDLRTASGGNTITTFSEAKTAARQFDREQADQNIISGARRLLGFTIGEGTIDRDNRRVRIDNALTDRAEYVPLDRAEAEAMRTMMLNNTQPWRPVPADRIPAELAAHRTLLRRHQAYREFEASPEGQAIDPDGMSEPHRTVDFGEPWWRLLGFPSNPQRSPNARERYFLNRLTRERDPGSAACRMVWESETQARSVHITRGQVEAAALGVREIEAIRHVPQPTGDADVRDLEPDRDPGPSGPGRESGVA